MKQSKLYDFLDEQGVLDTGTPADIERERRNYWRQYKSNWRRQKRAESKSITISLTHQEYTIIARSAKKQKMSVTKFVHTASLVFGQQQTMPIDEQTMGYIREALLLNYNRMSDLADDNQLSAITEQQLVQKLADIERVVVEKIKNPKLLEDAICEAIQFDPEYKYKIYELLKMI